MDIIEKGEFVYEVISFILMFCVRSSQASVCDIDVEMISFKVCFYATECPLIVF